MAQIWLTSDTHFGHEFVSGSRGFATTQEHDEALRRSWARQVAAEDEVWVLGDFSLGGWREALPFLADLPGKKHLVAGNHDRCHPLNSNGHGYLRAYLEHFETVTTVARLRHGGRSILLSHFPYDGDHLMVDGEDRATQWRLRDEGRLLLHGHMHDDVKIRRSQRGTTMIHVGLDAWGMKLVRLPELLADAERYEGVGSAPPRKD